MSNVKPGDRAIVIRSRYGNEGKIVIVGEEAPKGRHLLDGVWFKSKRDPEPLAWICEAFGGTGLNTNRRAGLRRIPIADYKLRPLPDDTETPEVKLAEKELT